ncbi:hypothetical protein [Aequorivita echinoideorum]|uniref:Uncharacterized protein n=1 Tax=Aequorivita echinoideorum TaxID=1549647 RepID=A0ABS5S5R0_9FLAO|nr:hypothetical protein [Aequorivita echinoideorum]MBT0608514.1 hypothetical protein [Aequorivita echinoideorum]
MKTKGNSEKEKNENAPKPQKRWDVKPGERTSDPKEQQIQRVWEESKKEQQENAARPGMDAKDIKQHDEDGNPRKKEK